MKEKIAVRYEDFIKKLEEDQKLAKQFGEKLEARGQLSEEEAWQSAAEAAKELGFDVEPAEFAAAVRGSQKISDEELDRVSGGKMCWKNLECNMTYYTCVFGDECTGHTHCDNIVSEYW